MRLAWAAFNQHDGSPHSEWAPGERARLLSALRGWQSIADYRRKKLNERREMAAFRKQFLS